MSARIATLLSLTTLGLLATPLHAAEKMLTAEEINKLIVGNTIHSEVLGSGKTFKVYFEANGKYTRVQGGEVTDSTYRTNADGTHCINFKGSDYCATIRDNGDGTFTRIEGGKPKIKWTRVVSGKDL